MIDIVSISVRSGKGGNGSGSFRREKYIPKGGPDGGDGGDGGTVWITADAHKNTLQHFQGSRSFSAQDGGDGGAQKMFGKKGDDTEVSVPLGTIVWEVLPDDTPEAPSRKKLGEILSLRDKFVVARGGLGGRGNVHFKSASNTTPLEYELGGEPTERQLVLELKLLADIGLVGFPNAGKSTLLAALTKAHPKIANYPFTTLAPHLGVVEFADGSGEEQYVLADIPGLIEQASEGKGLGHQFLRHIERCRLLVYVLFVEDYLLMNETVTVAELLESLVAQWKTLRHELVEYNAELVDRPYLVLLNKIDIIPSELTEELTAALRAASLGNLSEDDIYFTSGATHEGLEPFRNRLRELLRDMPREVSASEDQPNFLPVFSPEPEAGQPKITYKAKA